VDCSAEVTCIEQLKCTLMNAERWEESSCCSMLHRTCSRIWPCMCLNSGLPMGDCAACGALPPAGSSVTMAAGKSRPLQGPRQGVSEHDAAEDLGATSAETLWMLHC